jgi:hypothetical protein
MPIDLCNSIKGVGGYASSSSTLSGVFGSTIFTACLVTFVMILIVLVMYPAKRGTSFFVVGKMFVYMFMGNLLMLFLHGGVIKTSALAEYDRRVTSDFATSLSEPNLTHGNDYRQVVPSAAVRGGLETTGLPQYGGVQPTQDPPAQVQPTQPAPTSPEPPLPILPPEIAGGVALGGSSVLGGTQAPVQAGNPYAVTI